MSRFLQEEFRQLCQCRKAIENFKLNHPFSPNRPTGPYLYICIYVPFLCQLFCVDWGGAIIIGSHYFKSLSFEYFLTLENLLHSSVCDQN